MIIPTIGRIVLFTPANHPPQAQPHAAVVAHVHSNRCVNLAVFDGDGNQYARCSVRLIQDDDKFHEREEVAQWMPYQRAVAEEQAAKAAQVPQQ